ncbi:MAG: radical SAM protein [Desulfobacterales bacterium]|nr:MAG: radical SAM protein [Desulfobacterales bacterium]
MHKKNTRPFVIPIFIPHRGCPHHCVFCNQAAITGTTPGSFTVESLRLLIEAFIKFKGKQRQHVQVAFYGGNFLGLNKDTIRLFLDESTTFVKKGLIHSVRFSTRPDTINEKSLDFIKEYPISTIEIGLQSMDDQVLALSNRGHTANDTEKAVALLQNRKYEMGLQMMVGLPGDNEAKSLATAQKMVEFSPAFIRIYPTLVLENSLLASWYQKGKYTPWSLHRCVTLVKKIYLLFQYNKIPVIRMGLQASEDFDKGSIVVAGPYHPAFGHLVHSAVFFDKAKEALRSKKGLQKKVSIHVHPNSISNMRGLNNDNINRLKTMFHIQSLHIIADPVLLEDQLTVI